MQGRKYLMKNKNKFAFLTLVATAAMILAACGEKPVASSKEGVSSNIPSETTSEIVPSSETVIPSSQNSEQPSSEVVVPSSISSQSSQVMPSSSTQPSSSAQPSSSQPIESSMVVNKYTVTFVVDGQVVYTVQVDEGGTATYQGEEPTKAPDAQGTYTFTGWDKNINSPITQDTVFTAVFSYHSNVLMIDDFESYEESGDMIDEGWVALVYSNSTGTWTDQTGATVSLGTRSIEGEKSLKFEAWENGVGYKFAKTFKDNEFTDSANAIQFTLMAPSINKLTVLLNGTVTVSGQLLAPVFKYKPTLPSSEYVTYTIPFNDSDWYLWNDHCSIPDACTWAGIEEKDFLSHLTGIEFYLEGNDGTGLPYKAFLDSVKFVTLDNPSYVEQQYNVLYDRYTGTLNNDHILRIDIDHNNNAIASVIDLETPVQVGGTVEVNDNIVTFTSLDNGATLQYVGKMTNGGALIKFESATGALANDVEDMNLIGVQVVDNFEQYTEDGQSYYKNGPIDQRSGARGAYYQEYYAGGTNSSPWGGNGWSLMDNGDELKLIQGNDAHSGNQYLSLENKSNNANRFMQWGLYDGSSEKNSFRGSKMGFWAKTDGLVKQFTAYMYSQNAPTNQTKDNYVKKATFNETAALNEWKHYEIELNPDVVYYGFMILVEKHYMSVSRLFIDDIEIYGADPYAHYEEPVPEPEKDYNLIPGSVYYTKYYEYLKANLIITSLSDVKLSIPGLSQELTGTYTVDEYEITMVFDTVTYKATTDDFKSKLTFKSLSGSGSAASVLNNLSFDLELGDDAETYTEDGTMYYASNTDENARSGARGAYFCDYYKGEGYSDPLGGNGWTLMEGTGNQLQLDKATAYHGSQSIKIRKNSSLDMRYLQWNLYKGDSAPITGMNKFVVYYKNPNAEAITVRTMVYKIAQVTPSTQGADNRAEIDFVVPANSDWVRCELELDPNTTYYGFAMMPRKGGSVTGFINFDYAHYVKNGYESDFNYYVKKGDILTNAYTSAKITFGDPGQLTFDYADQGIEDLACAYTMEMVGSKQVMTFTVNDVTLIGEYKFMYNGSLYFSIDSFENGPLGELLIMDAFYK